MMPPRIARAARGLALIGMSLWLPGAGCGLFDTREPVTGDTDSGTWVPPTRAEIVVENLERAFEAGVFTDYQRALTENFTFTPDDTDVATYEQERPGEDVYGSWTREVEALTAEAIRTAADSLDLVLDFKEEELVTEGRLRKYDYQLHVIVGEAVTEYVGEVRFVITQVAGGDWVITGWEDVASDPQTPSWGFLKGANRLL
ncbi:hypothetical protein K8I85_02265 [bacterium]|nr:hypothetical protein [bacterium]